MAEILEPAGREQIPLKLITQSSPGSNVESLIISSHILEFQIHPHQCCAIRIEFPVRCVTTTYVVIIPVSDVFAKFVIKSHY